MVISAPPGASFWQVLEAVFTHRADAAAMARRTELSAALAKEVEAAATIARQQAAQLADGQRLTVDTPQAIAEKHRAAIEAIDVDALPAELVRATSPLGARRIAEKHALEQLVQQESGTP
jgi:hypothetical protein